jgi:spore coat protein CotH
MKLLWLKRLLIGFVLATTIFGLGYYNYITAATGYTGLTRLANNRKQKTDYANLFNHSLYKSITIVFEETVFDQLITSMEAYFELYGTYQDNSLHKVDMIYSDGLGNRFTIEEVGFRTKSNTSRNLPRTLDWRGRLVYYQTSFQLQFNATFDYAEDSNEYGVLNGREVFNLDQLNFEYSKTIDAETDEAMISEAFSYYLYQQAGVNVSNASYGLVYFQIGDELIGYGFYNYIEPIDNNYLSKNFDSNVIGDYGDLFKCTDAVGIADLSVHYEELIGFNVNEINERYSYALKNHTKNDTRSDFSILTDFIDDINDIDYFEAHAASLIDVDAFLRALAMGFLIGSSDDYRNNYNNYYLYFEVYTDQVYYIPFDLDSSLGFGKHQDLTGNYGVNYNIIAMNEMAILVHQVLSIEAFRTRYVDYLDEFVTQYFQYADFHAEYLNAKNLYEAVLIAENHLGNQAFNIRNSEWYFTQKTENVVSQIALIRSA